MHFQIVKDIKKLIKNEKINEVIFLSNTRNRAVLKIITNRNNYILKYFRKLKLFNPLNENPIKLERRNLFYLKKRNLIYFLM